jgi:CelD/BcsL family acetyltransferase involved in cellulose biosynthesis
VLGDTYGWDIRALVFLDAMGEPVAGICFCRITDIMGRRIVALPFSDYCDPLVWDREHWNRLIAELVEEDCPLVVRCLHNSLPTTDERFILVKQAKWHGMDLQPDLDTLWHGLHDSSRRAIAKAQRAGVVVRIAEQEEELQEFFDMHLRIRKYKYGLLAQPYSFFINIWRHFIKEQRGILMLAVYQSEIIGGVMFLEWRDGLYYKFNASEPFRLAQRPNDQRPNDLLVWHGIQYGKAKGYRYLDFGLSDWDQEGLVRYKRKFATEEKAISFLRYALDGSTTQLEQQLRDLLTELTNLFIDESVPDTVTARAGDVMYRFFA